MMSRSTTSALLGSMAIFGKVGLHVCMQCLLACGAYPARPGRWAALVVSVHRHSRGPNCSYSKSTKASSFSESETTSSSNSKNCTAPDNDCVWVNSAAVVAAYPGHVVSILALENVVRETLCCYEPASVPPSIFVFLTPVTEPLSHVLVEIIIAARNSARFTGEFEV